jgi:hypothetical protein
VVVADLSLRESQELAHDVNWQGERPGGCGSELTPTPEEAFDWTEARKLDDESSANGCCSLLFLPCEFWYGCIQFRNSHDLGLCQKCKTPESQLTLTSTLGPVRSCRPESPGPPSLGRLTRKSET